MTAQHRRFVAVALVTSGLLAVLLGGGAFVAAWRESSAFEASGAAEQARRQLGTLEDRPEWIEPGVASSVPRPSPAAIVRPPQAGSAARGQGDAAGDAPASVQTGSGPAAAASVTALPTPTPPPRAPAEAIELVGIDFRFIDPPEPGAHARIAVELRNDSELPSDPVGLVVPAKWFDGYEVVGAVPPVEDDRQDEDGARRFEFPGLQSHQEITLEVHLTATDEDLSAPEVVVSLPDGSEIGRSRPRTVAPRPRPGPARALSIPRLQLQAAVVQTTWEPPQFVVGQLKNSASVSEGNTVMVGHLRGPSGNVFANIDRLSPGDEILAVSRGLEYRFIVSDKMVLPNSDSSPTFKTDSPRLTLMTCTGTWNPLTDDYSHRVWVIAEPPELAEATIAANAERSAQATATAVADAAAAEAAALDRDRRGSEEAGGAPTEVSAVPEEAGAASLGTLSTERAAAAPTLTARPTPTLGPRPPSPGLQVRSPANQARVPAVFTIRGTRNRPVDPNVHVWLAVRADVHDSRWYAYPREILARPDGSWELELQLGGDAGVRHELRLGVVDPSVQVALERHAAEQPNQPLDDLPAGFWTEASVTVTRR